jgi:hypothetical protein
MWTDSAYLLSWLLFSPWLPARRIPTGIAGSASAYSARIEKRFALLVSDIPDAAIKAPDPGRAESQLDYCAGLQSLLRASLGPAGAQEESRVRNQFSGPMLNFTLIVHSIKHEPGMRIGVLELDHSRFRLPEMVHIIGDATSVVGRK